MSDKYNHPSIEGHSNNFTNERHEWLDYLRGIAAILVVLLHVSAGYLYQYNRIEIYSWNVGNYIDAFTRVSVPIFFMISGFLFFQNKKPKAKHFIRIFLALIFYSAISLIYMKLYKGQSISLVSMSTLQQLIKGDIYYHLWFFYIIPIIYLLSYLVTIRVGEGHYVMVVFVVLFLIANTQTSVLIGFFDYNYRPRFTLDGDVTYYILFAIFGAILGNQRVFEYKQLFCFCIAIYLFSSLSIGYGTYVLTTNSGNLNLSLYSYSSPLVSIGSLSTFILVKEFYKKLDFFRRPLLFISKNSLAIYGIHALVLDAITASGYRDFKHPFMDISITFILTLMISAFFAAFIKYVDKKGLVT